MTSFSDWMGDDMRTSTMGLDEVDLPERTQDLKRREDVLRDESRRLDEVIERATEALDELQGEGVAEKGAVTVLIDSRHRLVDVKLTPKALRLASTDLLREAILAAYTDAIDDLEHQLSEIVGEPPTDPLETYLEQIPEIARLLPPSLRTPPPPDPPEEGSNAR